MQNKIVVIVGPTASDKTKTAIELAKKIYGEIISSDSMQVYKNMPVLTQSPSKKDIGEVPHYLIAEISPEEEYSAAEFSKRAELAISDIIKKGKIPIIVGGTGLYVKALIDGLFPSPKKDVHLRKRLELSAKKMGTAHLHNKLKRIDPESAGKIHPNDKKRIIRALEIYHLTKTVISEHKKKTKGISGKYEIMELGLTMPREDLYEKINRRVEEMFRCGVISEVKGLTKFNLSITAGSAIGINEIRDFLEGKRSLEETKELIKKNTRRYAKRQITWFRADERIKWFEDGKSLIDYCRSWI